MSGLAKDVEQQRLGVGRAKQRIWRYLDIPGVVIIGPFSTWSEDVRFSLPGLGLSVVLPDLDSPVDWRFFEHGGRFGRPFTSPQQLTEHIAEKLGES